MRKPFVSLRLGNDPFLSTIVFDDYNKATNYFERLIRHHGPNISENKLFDAVNGGFFKNEKVTIWFGLTEKEELR